MEGCVLSMGQVWAVQVNIIIIFSHYTLLIYYCIKLCLLVQNLATSLIMWVAVALYSPVLFILSAIGAVLGSFLPLIFLSNNLCPS